MTDELLQRYGLKFHPFLPGIPLEALYEPAAVEAFGRRVQSTVGDGGFVMITGDPGTGKSAALRLLAHRLGALVIALVG